MIVSTCCSAAAQLGQFTTGGRWPWFSAIGFIPEGAEDLRGGDRLSHVPRRVFGHVYEEPERRRRQTRATDLAFAEQAVVRSRSELIERAIERRLRGGHDAAERFAARPFRPRRGDLAFGQRLAPRVGQQPVRC